MFNASFIRDEISKSGFAIIENIFNAKEINSILEVIPTVDTDKATFRKTKDLFAIRQFLKEVPATYDLIFTERLNSIITQVLGVDYFITKSIYFDKPGESNWFVAYHQDLTISVDKKIDIPGYGPWTVKQNQFAVQPPVCILKNSFTIRIHLDDTDKSNGALKVIPGSHLKDVCRTETIDWMRETETICNVTSGSVMIMKPLLFHASNRSINNNKRRVIHIEFSNQELENGLKWSEKEYLKKKQ